MDTKYYSYPKEKFDEGKIRTVCLESSEAVFRAMAEEMARAVRENNEKGEKTVFIVPVGPVGQYPFFAQLAADWKLSLKNVWLINMDEYLDDSRHWIAKDHLLSFRGFMDRSLYKVLPQELNVPASQRIFPDPDAPEKILSLIQELGKVDICFGGIGINGHLAFNEAEDVSAEEFAERRTRVIEISRETRTANAIGDLNGAIDAMPKYAVTVGMKEILSARKIRLGVFRPWHRAVVRRALFDSPSGSFPVTLIQNHPDSLIYVNDVAAGIAF